MNSVNRSFLSPVGRSCKGTLAEYVKVLDDDFCRFPSGSIRKVTPLNPPADSPTG